MFKLSAVKSVKDPRIHFYREKSGLEVDIVEDEGGSVHLYEVKTGTTLRTENLNKMEQIGSRFSCPVISTVIFDGRGYPPTSVNIREI